MVAGENERFPLFLRQGRERAAHGVPPLAVGQDRLDAFRLVDRLRDRFSPQNTKLDVEITGATQLTIDVGNAPQVTKQ